MKETDLINQMWETILDLIKQSADRGTLEGIDLTKYQETTGKYMEWQQSEPATTQGGLEEGFEPGEHLANNLFMRNADIWTDEHDWVMSKTAFENWFNQWQSQQPQKEFKVTDEVTDETLTVKFPSGKYAQVVQYPSTSRSEEVRNMIDTNEWIDRAIGMLDDDIIHSTISLISLLQHAKESHTYAKHHLWKEMFEEWTASIKQQPE